MELTAYRAIEANRRQSRFLAAVNAVTITVLFAIAVWMFGPDAVRAASYLVIVIGSALFGGRDLILMVLGARPFEAFESPRLYRRLDVLCAGLGLRRPPAVYLVVAPQPNAFAIERVGEAGTLVVTGRLLDLADDELDAVLAHELSHLAAAFVGLRAVMALFRGLVMAVAGTRTRWHRIATALIVLAAVLVLGPAPLVFGVFVALYLVAEARISREREYLADAQAILVTRHPDGLIRALRRMTVRDPLLERIAPVATTLTLDAERLAASLWTVPTGAAAGWSSRIFDAHPSTGDRIRRAERMS